MALGHLCGQAPSCPPSVPSQMLRTTSAIVRHPTQFGTVHVPSMMRWLPDRLASITNTPNLLWEMRSHNTVRRYLQEAMLMNTVASLQRVTVGVLTALRAFVLGNMTSIQLATLSAFCSQTAKGAQPLELAGHDRDSHGCYPSAGYVWCAARSSCIRPWEHNLHSPQEIKAVCSSQQTATTQTLAAAVRGGDRDSHGCYHSAGYTWCEVSSSCIRPWERSC